MLNKVASGIGNNINASYFDTNPAKLFPFATKHPEFKAPLNEDSFILCHTTHDFPNNGILRTARDLYQCASDNIHFAINRVLCFPDRFFRKIGKYFVLIPIKPAIETNDFQGGASVDFYSKGNVKIPEGSVIVRKNSSVPKGQYRVLDASQIEELQQTKGLKVIETPEDDNLYSATEIIMQKLGYDVEDSKSRSIEDKDLDGIKLFNQFLIQNNMKPMLYRYTPNGQVEVILTSIHDLSRTNPDWKLHYKGEILFDYKTDMLEHLKYLSKKAKKDDYPMDYDIDSITEIVKQSQSPKDAINTIYKTMNITSMFTQKTMDNSKWSLDDGIELDQLLMYNTFKQNDKNIKAAEKLIKDPTQENCRKFFKHHFMHVSDKVTPHVADAMYDMYFEFEPKMLEILHKK